MTALQPSTAQTIDIDTYKNVIRRQSRMLDAVNMAKKNSRRDTAKSSVC